jgi:hypothetical protein
MKSLLLVVLAFFALNAYAAGDSVMIQDQIQIVQDQHALVMHQRSMRPAQDAAFDSAYLKQLASLQASLIQAQASPSPSPSGH